MNFPFFPFFHPIYLAQNFPSVMGDWRVSGNSLTLRLAHNRVSCVPMKHAHTSRRRARVGTSEEDPAHERRREEYKEGGAGAASQPSSPPIPPSSSPTQSQVPPASGARTTSWYDVDDVLPPHLRVCALYMSTTSVAVTCRALTFVSLFFFH